MKNTRPSRNRGPHDIELGTRALAGALAEANRLLAAY
jgi:hypothetical protein